MQQIHQFRQQPVHPDTQYCCEWLSPVATYVIQAITSKNCLFVCLSVLWFVLLLFSRPFLFFPGEKQGPSGRDIIPAEAAHRPVGRTNPTRPVQLFIKDNHGVKILLIAKHR